MITAKISSNHFVSTRICVSIIKSIKNIIIAIEVPIIIKPFKSNFCNVKEIILGRYRYIKVTAITPIGTLIKKSFSSQYE